MSGVERGLSRNEVLLVGRVSAEPMTRVLPSGTPIVTFRLIVERARTPMTRGSAQKSDWVVCSAWSAGQRRAAAGLRAGELIEVRGSLRRRHTGMGSLVEIEMMSSRRIRTGS